MHNYTEYGMHEILSEVGAMQEASGATYTAAALMLIFQSIQDNTTEIERLRNSLDSINDTLKDFITLQEHEALDRR